MTPALWKGLPGLGLSILLTGCAAPLTGVGSLTLLAAPESGLGVEPIGPPVKVRQCANSVLGFIQWADVSPTHETVIAQALAETGADLLLAAQVFTTQSNFVFYVNTCTQVEGTPARYTRGSP